MKKLFILLSLLFLCSCSSNGTFISDVDLENYGLLAIKEFVPSTKFHTNKYADKIYSFMQIDDNEDCINFNKKLLQHLNNDEAFEYFGYTLSETSPNDGSTLIVYTSEDVLDFYHSKPLSYEAGKVYFSSCRFFYLQKETDVLYEIHVNSYSNPKRINGKNYNMSIYLTTYNDFVLN